MDQLFQDFSNMSKSIDFPNINIPVLFKGNEPKVDIIQEEKNIIVKADIPGVKKEDIHVTVTDDAITLKGEAKADTETKKENYFHSERFYGCFSRTLPLPAAVDPKKATAKFEEGVLTVMIPKIPATEKGTAVAIE